MTADSNWVPRSVSRRAVLSTAGAASLLGCATAPSPESTLSPVVVTRQGRVQGLRHGTVCAFKGMRYAAPPVGSLRFRPPQPLESWPAIKTAFDFGAPAMQMPGGPSEDPATEMAAELSRLFTVTSDMGIDNEDCLFLNVWSAGVGASPARPVMVWLHGGGFANGSAAWPFYDGANLARRDVVLVSINHRLNAFGYLHLRDLMGEEFAASGNVGMLDVVHALEWVRDNIAAFGGDPDNVTVFGQSGGGAKVSHLMAMPSATGLFHKAIIQSTPWLRSLSRDAANDMAIQVLAELDIKAGDIRALQSIPADQLLSAAHRVSGRMSGPLKVDAASPFSPVVDGEILPDDPFSPEAPSISSSVPLLIGSTKDEATLFSYAAPWWGRLTEEELIAQSRGIAGDRADALVSAIRSTYPDYSPSYVLAAVIGSPFLAATTVIAERKSALQSAPVFVYQVAWETPVQERLFRAPHGLELPFVFDNVDRARVWVGSGPAPRALAHQMAGSWVAFAATGDPNNRAIPAWPTYDAHRRSTMMFDTEPHTKDDPTSAIRRAILSA